MTDTFRALCAELVDAWLKGDDIVGAMNRARAALADEPAAGEPASVTGQPSDGELLDLLPQGIESGFWLPQGLPSDWVDGEFIAPPKAIIAFARDVLELWGNPAPQPPAKGEVEELVAWLRSNALTVKKASGNPANGARQRMNRAAELLQHLSPPQPVPVSERLQQMEDLAADAVAELRYIEQSHWRLYGVGWDRVYKKADRLKPAHALPLPGQEVEG